MDDDLYEAVLLQAKRRRALLATPPIDAESLQALAGIASLTGGRQPATGVIQPSTHDEIVGFFA